MSTCPTLLCGAPEHPPDSEALQSGVEAFLEHGCMLVKGAFSPDYIGELCRTYVYKYRGYFQERQFGDALAVGNKRTQITVDVEGPFNSPQLYANACVLPLLKGLLGDELILGSVGSVVSLPGALDQHVHRDHPNIYELPAAEATSAWVDMLLPPYAVTAIVPLVPMNAANGTTRLWLGSHLVSKAETMRMPTVDPVADVGDCLLMDYRLLHGGTANQSQNLRPILYNVYHRPWFRDSRNYRKQRPIRIPFYEYLKIPPEHRYLFDWLQGDQSSA